MVSLGRRVIKSEQVRYVCSPAAMASVSGRSQAALSPVSGSTPTAEEASISKIRLAEQAAYEKGLSEGRQQGMALQKSETLHALEAISGIVREVSALKEEILEKSEREIVQLSLHIAEKVIHQEVKTNREVIRSVLKEAIKGIVNRESMKIRLHPQDFQFMMEVKTDFLQGFDGIGNIAFEEDRSIQRGGAIIETLYGEVDARVEQQQKEIEALMVSADRSGSPPGGPS